MLIEGLRDVGYYLLFIVFSIMLYDVCDIVWGERLKGELVILFVGGSDESFFILIRMYTCMGGYIYN